MKDILKKYNAISAAISKYIEDGRAIPSELISEQERLIGLWQTSPFISVSEIIHEDNAVWASVRPSIIEQIYGNL